MKRIFTLASALLLTGSLLALSPKSILSITGLSKNPFAVNIDNRNYSQELSNEVIVRNINPGYHRIKIVSSKVDRYERDKRWSNSQALLYNEIMYVRPGTHVDITINRFGKAFIDERKINQDDCEEDGYDWNSQGHYNEPMSENEFEQMKQTISNGSFDNTKMLIARQIIDQHYFRPAQVKEMLNLFSFESSKLDIAKYAYKNSVDKNNYFIVNDAFTFSSSKEELAKFLQSSR